MRGSKLVLLLCCAVLCTVTSLAQESEIKTLGPDEFWRLYKSDTSAILIDVRTKMEFKRRRIEGAVNMPKRALLAQFTDTLARDISIYVYCTTSKRSGGAAQFLISKGRMKVVNLDGGLKRWREAGMPVVGKKEE